MKVLIHSNAPWMPTGYGRQAAIAGKLLDQLGHGVSYSAFAGLSGQPIKWGKHAVYPAGMIPFSPDTIVPNARVAQADLIISLMDTYKLAPAADELRTCGIPFVPLVVTDCIAENGGPSVPDQQFIARSGALPAAVSRFGHDRLGELGPDDWDIPYVPHAVDTSIYKPPADRSALREEMGTKGDFLIGIHGANRDGVRKGYPEQFAAFARFARKHKDARLAVFAVADSPGGLPLAEIASDLGILDRLVFMPTFEQNAGLLADDFMATWYASIDVLSICSYAEGFGIPALEAQACGTPIVATDCSALAELARSAGWLVEGHRFWNAVHRAWWVRPAEGAIVKAWEAAYQEGAGQARTHWGDRSQRAVAFARGYDLEHAAKHWAGLIRDVQDWQDSRDDD